MAKHIILVIGFCFFAFMVSANVIVDGYFNKDSIKLGEPVQYILKATYPAEDLIIYPDSNADFSPLEYSSKTYGRTTCNDSTCTDSAIYTLKAFELDKVQHLSLPVYIINGSDSTLRHADTSAIHLQFTIKELPDSLAFRYSLNLADMEEVTNYQHAIAWTVGGVIISVLLIILLYKPLRSLIQKSRDQKKYKQFVRTLQPLVEQADSAADVDKFAQGWKNFMEYIEQKPVSSMTTREIYRLYKDEELKKLLQQVDGMMYKSSGAVDRTALRSLYDYAINHFQTHKSVKDE